MSKYSSIGVISPVFFIWGFLTSLNAVMVPYMQKIFELSYSSSMLVQIVFYSAPFLACIPASKLMKIVGYKKTLILSLSLMFLGSLLIYPALEMLSFYAVLGAIFIIALGVASLQVVGNPCVLVAGSPQNAASRLTFCSAMNSLGTTISPYIVVSILLTITVMSSENIAGQLTVPYLLCAAFTLLIIFIVIKHSFPESKPVVENVTPTGSSLLNERTFLFGVLAIFCYVGAEISIATFMLSYISHDDLGGLHFDTAAKFVAFYWAGSMVGRLIGPVIFRYISALDMLLINVVTAACLLVFAMNIGGNMGVASLVLIGLCNSIMYPVIFSTALKGLGDNIERGSAVLVMAGIGGAAWSMIQAFTADQLNLGISFVVPLSAYLVILGFSLHCRMLK
ncbi:MFS transporter [Psychromonas ossibalaenae]|uniref:MFS transporter n=1 Tax=Psychromonas ossibalaenae TaxID=444922 RepID=UPI0003674B52|nr:MFS transporter [Psychromonas ossibalaenae]